MAAGFVLFDRLPLLLLAGAAAAGGFAMLRWPDVTTLAAIGLVYSNLPVVAVRFHGAPALLPAAALAMFFWPLFYRLCVRREKLLLLPASPFLLLFAIVQLLGALFSRDPQFAFFNFVWFVLEGAVVYLVITNLIRTRRMAISTFWVLCGCAILMGGAPLVQQLTGSWETNFAGLAQSDAAFEAAEDAVAGEVQQSRSSGTIGETNRYAQCMIVLAPIAFSLISFGRSRGERLFGAAGGLAALAGAALAFSRGTAVGMALAFLAAVALKLVTRTQIKLALAGVVVALLLAPQYLVRLSSLASLAGVISPRESGLSQADGAIRGRVTEMAAAALAFRDHPLIGVGPGMFRRHSREYGQMIGLRSLAEERQAHSLPLDIAAEHGICGLFAMGGVLFAVIHTLVRGRNAALAAGDRVGEQLATGMLLAVLLYLTTGLFLHLSHIRYFWLLIALGDAVGHTVAEEHPAAAPCEPRVELAAT